MTEADHLAGGRMGRKAVVAAVDFGDRQRNLLAQRGRQGAHGQGPCEVQVGLKHGR